ncbi:MAG: dTMP kinase [Pseudohongiellaceae bacterium]|jgi:dTMP kinase
MSKHEKGRFITLEGVEGVGKSTNLEVIQRFLQHRGVDYIVTREPGGTPVAEEMRQLLLANRDEKLHEISELLLVFAARSQHLEALIKPALAKGVWVLCDRFTDATYAYQGGGRKLDKNTIATLETLAQGDLRPDLTFILDLDPEIGLQRASQRGELDRFENEQVSFFHRVRATYLARAEADPERCRVIDASAPIESVEHQLIELLEQQFGANT